MAERQAPGSDGPDPSGWMLTFSDMMTLLLTFFVMLISITSLEPGTLAEIDYPEQGGASAPARRGPGSLGFSNPSLVSALAELVGRLEDLPPNVNLDQDEIKAAIFRLEPSNDPDYQRLEREVTDAVSVFRDDRGMVIRWDRAIVFPEGSAIIREENMVLLSRMAELLASLSLPFSVDSHTNPMSDLEGGADAMAAFGLSTRRSKVVLEHFAALGLQESRMRLGSFGGSRPVTREPSRGGENSRLEIVIYTPAKSSWKG